MGDAARDIAPGGGTLRLEHVGDVVERHHDALVGLGRAFAGDAHVVEPVASVAGELDLTLHQTVLAVARLGQRLRDLGHDALDGRAEQGGDRAFASIADEMFGRRITRW